MFNKYLTIDVWDSESLMHFGACKLPLNLLMLQNEDSKVVGQQFDIVETENANVVGGLQLILTNAGSSEAPP